MVYWYVTCGWDWYIEMSSDWTNWWTLVHLVWPTCASWWWADSFSIPIPAGKYIRVRVSWTNGYGSYATIATVVMFDVQ
jgi:hypothetical protein